MSYAPAIRCNSCVCGANSFSADTEVSTPEGDVPISEIEVGDTVLAYNEETGTTGEYTVTDTISHVDEIIIHLTINGELIETTSEHPFLTADESWVNASELEIGDQVLSLGGVYGTVEAVEVIQDANQPMYNLTIEEVHTFAVGDGDWVVHNENLSTGCTIILGAGGNRSAYTNDDVKFLAPVSQIASVMRGFPQNHIISIDLGAGGVSSFLNNPASRQITQMLATINNIDISIPNGALSNFAEITANYDAIPFTRGIADNVINFYPNTLAIEPSVRAATALLKPGGGFYSIVDSSDALTMIMNNLDSRYWDIPSTMPNQNLISNPRLSVRQLVVHSGHNPIGISGFSTAQSSINVWDVFARRR